MRSVMKLPMFVIATALLALIVLLAVLQYRWIGRISEAETVRMRALLNERASAFARDFDSELTRAYLLFQVDPVDAAGPADGSAARLAERSDRWQATARYPRIISQIYTVARQGSGSLRLWRFDPTTRQLEAVEWPSSLLPLRRDPEKADSLPPSGDRHLMVRTMPPPVWDDIPALVVPTPIRFVDTTGPATSASPPPGLAYTVLLLDDAFISGEMIPALAHQHLRGTGDAFEYQAAVVSMGGRVVYRTTEAFSPRADEKGDASAELFHVRSRDFGAIAAEVRRFVVFTGRGSRSETVEMRTVRDRLILPTAEGFPAPATAGAPRWRIIVKHPSGSLEHAVNAVRRRNLLVSSSILAVLAASLALLTVSTRRAQDLARQQMAFVAAVSHELRTPLAVIRSAGDNLADGVVHDPAQTRKYGDLVRTEGRRLTEMVEQILEFAGIDSGQRGLALTPVDLGPLLHDLVDSSRALLDAGGLQLVVHLPDGLPPVLGDATALRRAFQNLLSNAMKYGGSRIELRAEHVGREVHVTVADRGIGILPAEQSRIFDPFYRAPAVMAAQIQGAGLGLSLVKRIVDAHGGRIAVHSAPAAGTRFVVVLPSAGDADADAIWSRQPSGEGAGA